jgi:hypothetical protein
MTTMMLGLCRLYVSRWTVAGRCRALACLLASVVTCLAAVADLVESSHSNKHCMRFFYRIRALSSRAFW